VLALPPTTAERRRIADVAPVLGRDIELDEVTLEDAQRPGDAVDYLAIHRHADVAGVAVDSPGRSIWRPAV